MQLVVLRYMLDIYNSLRNGDCGTLIIFRRLLLKPRIVLPIEALDDELKQVLDDKSWSIMHHILEMAKQDPSFDTLWRLFAEHLDVMSSLYGMLPESTISECVSSMLHHEEWVSDSKKRKECSELLLKSGFLYVDAINNQWRDERIWVNHVIEEAYKQEIRSAMAHDESYENFLVVFREPRSWEYEEWGSSYKAMMSWVSYYRREAFGRVSDLLQGLHNHRENKKEEYDSYEDYVQNGFLREGRQELVDNEFEHCQIERRMRRMRL
ncbi:hypothetical protein F4703DRAFT_1869046 [Phycomyces blakesleeanus]